MPEYKIRVRRFLFWRTFAITGHKLDASGGVPILTMQLANGRRRIITSSGSLDVEVIPPYRQAARLVEPAAPPRPMVRPFVMPPPAAAEAFDHAPYEEAVDDPDETTEEPSEAPAEPETEPAPLLPPAPRGRLETEARTVAQRRLRDMIEGRVRA